MADDLDLPVWMTRAGAGVRLRPPAGGTRRESTVQRTLTGLSNVVRETVFAERVATRPGILQKVDPRIKTVGLLGLLIVTAFLRQWYLLMVLYGSTLLMAAASGLDLRFFIKRVWIFIPLFAGIIALPSIFNVFRGGDPLWTIWDYGHEVTIGPWSLGTSLAITYQGLKGAVVLILRVATSVSLAVLLALTTRWGDLLKALRVFLVPRLFILILSMTYRYIFLLLSLAGDMFTARASRMVGPSSPREDRRFVAHTMGTLLGKSHTLSDEVYAAMISRGYNGEPVASRNLKARPYDWIWLATVALLGAAVVWGDRLLG